MEQFTFSNSTNSETPLIVNASEHHMALLFLLDTSGSMSMTIMGSHSTPINELNKAMNRFKAEVCHDEHTKDILDVAVVEFNNRFSVVQEFSPVEYLKPVELQACGQTFLSEPLNAAMDMVTERSRLYRRSGAEPYKPWIVIITDGMAMDDPSALNDTIRRVNDMVDNQKANVWALLVGDAAEDTEVRKLFHELCGKRVLRLEGYDFTGFLDWTHKSMRAVSQSSPGERIKAEPLPQSTTIDPMDELVN